MQDNDQQMQKLNQMKLKFGLEAFYAVQAENRSGVFYSSQECTGFKKMTIAKLCLAEF